MAATKITPKEFVEALKDWSILDVVEAVKAIEDEFGIKAAAPVAAAAVAGPAAEGAAPGEGQTGVTLTPTPGGGSKIKGIKAVPQPTQPRPEGGQGPVAAPPKPAPANRAEGGAAK